MSEKQQLRRSTRITTEQPKKQQEQLPPLISAKKVVKLKTQASKPTKTDIDNFLEIEQKEQGNYAITKEQLEFLLKQYFETKDIFGLGRDRIFQYLRQKNPEMNISRRQVNRFLQSLEVVQLFNPTKGTKDIAKTITEAPFKRFELDLVDFQNMESQGYKYVINFIDTFVGKQRPTGH